MTNMFDGNLFENHIATYWFSLKKVVEYSWNEIHLRCSMSVKFQQMPVCLHEM